MESTVRSTRMGWFVVGTAGIVLVIDQVVDHYDQLFQLGLAAKDKSDLVQYLLSL